MLLVDSALLHHLLLPPRGLAWHYSRLVGSDAAGPGLLEGDVDGLLFSAGYADLSSQNPSALADLLCADLSRACRSPAGAPRRAAPCADAALRERFLYVRTDQYLVPALLRNRFAGPALRRMLGTSPDGEGAFGLLGRYVIRPKRSVSTQVHTAYTRLVAAGGGAAGGGAAEVIRSTLTVGMQVRGGPAVPCVWVGPYGPF